MTPASVRKPEQDLDEQLASFVDRVSLQALTRADAPAGSELRGLEEVVLRLSRVFPATPLPDQAVHRIHAKVAPHARDAVRNAARRWRPAHDGRRFAMVLAAGLAAIGLLAVVPALSSAVNGGTAAAMSAMPAGLITAGLAGIILLVILLRSRK